MSENHPNFLHENFIFLHFYSILFYTWYKSFFVLLLDHTNEHFTFELKNLRKQLLNNDDDWINMSRGSNRENDEESCFVYVVLLFGEKQEKIFGFKHKYSMISDNLQGKKYWLIDFCPENVGASCYCATMVLLKRFFMWRVHRLITPSAPVLERFC